MANGLAYDWDEANVGHIARHGVTPGEVESVLGRKPVVIRIEHRGGERRVACMGETDAGRHLVVVYTIRERKRRVVTAFPMNRKARREYAQQKTRPN